MVTTRDRVLSMWQSEVALVATNELVHHRRLQHLAKRYRIEEIFWVPPPAAGRDALAYLGAGGKSLPPLESSPFYIRNASNIQTDFLSEPVQLEQPVPPTPTEVLAHPMCQGAAMHVRAVTRGDEVPEPCNGDDAGTQAYLSFLHFKIAEAKRTKKPDAAAPFEHRLETFIEWSAHSKYASFNPWWWFVEAEHIAAHFRRATYRDCCGDLNKSVIKYEIPSNSKVAIIGDWGTGLEDAKALLRQIKECHSPSALIHLGDIFYSGTKRECRRHFLDVVTDVFDPMIPVFTIPGNHDYFTSGKGFYWLIDNMYAANPYRECWKQSASYFCLRTEDHRWQFLGMDTGVSDSHAYRGYKYPKPPRLKESEIEWHCDKLRNFEGRSILLSHHQPFSGDEVISGPDLYENVHLLRYFKAYRNKIAAWFWGHEHRFRVFEDNFCGVSRGRLLGSSAFDVRAATQGSNEDQTQYAPFKPIRVGANDDGYANHAYAILDFAQKLAKVSYFEFPCDQWTAAPALPPVHSEILI